jgi:hypothetical protein
LLAPAIWLPTATAQCLPPDAKPTATVPAQAFASWFEEGKPTSNGVIKPADSLNFSNDPCLENVDFYQWSEQMFLWLTSPARNTIDGDAGIVLNSPAFFRLSPRDGSNPRYLIQNGDSHPRLLDLRAAKPGPNGLPVIFDKVGRLYEVKLPELSRTQEPLVLSMRGPVPVHGIRFLHNGKVPFEFLDRKDARVSNPRPILPPTLCGRMVVQPFTCRLVQPFAVGYVTVFLDSSGKPIDMGQGQGGDINGALLTQDSALIYYMTSVNDGYAYFWKGTKGGGISPPLTRFPTTRAELSKITAYAKATGYTLLNPNTLCLQIKTSWVEADSLPDHGRNRYITMTATIPTYDKCDQCYWPRNGSKPNTKLALLGMHISGSVRGHPEMIWATFEHFGNTPNAIYRYNPKTGPTRTVCQNTEGAWLFCRSGATGAFNDSSQSVQEDGAIMSTALTSTGQCRPIGPTDILRGAPYGASLGERPNPCVPDDAASNTQIISMNNSVRAQLPRGDIRTNYFMLGATWTDGKAPTDAFPKGGNVMGTSRLANSTMETFTQGTNCFGCHNDNLAGRAYPVSRTDGATPVTTNVSHIFRTVKGLRLRKL